MRRISRRQVPENPSGSGTEEGQESAFQAASALAREMKSERAEGGDARDRDRSRSLEAADLVGRAPLLAAAVSALPVRCPRTDRGTAPLQAGDGDAGGLRRAAPGARRQERVVGRVRALVRALSGV